MSARLVSPFDYNLLELYRQHRDEIDAITDPTSLFILAFTNQVGRGDIDTLAKEVGLSLVTFRTKLTPLLRGQFMVDNRGILGVTAAGKRLLTDLGFIVPPPVGPSESPKKPEPPAQSEFVRRPVPQTIEPTTTTAGWLWSAIGFLTTTLIAVIALIVGLVVFRNPPPPPPMPVPTPLVIHIAFYADRSELTAGECTTLHWNVENAGWIEIDGRRVEPTNSMEVCPPQTQTFRLIVNGRPDATVPVTINVEPPTPTSESTPTPTPPDTFTPISTPTGTRTPTPTPPNTGSPTPSRTTTPLPTSTPTPSRTMTLSPTQTATPSPTPLGRVQGYVMRAYDQKAIPGATIQLTPSGMVIVLRRTITLDGSYGFTGLNPDRYTLTASATGYQTQNQSVTIGTGTSSLNFFLIKLPVQPKSNATLLLSNCFDFDSGIFVACGEGDNDIQLKEVTPSTRLRGNIGISLANPQNEAYESCKTISDSEISPLAKSQYICVLTTKNQVAVIHITAIDSSPLGSSITFDWWRY